MLAKNTSQGIYRNIKSFGRVDRVPCKVMKQWEDRALLRSGQSILVLMVNRLSLSVRQQCGVTNSIIRTISRRDQTDASKS